MCGVLCLLGRPLGDTMLTCRESLSLGAHVRKRRSISSTLKPFPSPASAYRRNTCLRKRQATCLSPLASCACSSRLMALFHCRRPHQHTHTEARVYVVRLSTSDSRIILFRRNLVVLIPFHFFKVLLRPCLDQNWRLILRRQRVTDTK